MSSKIVKKMRGELQSLKRHAHRLQRDDGYWNDELKMTALQIGVLSYRLRGVESD
jgi:hypothetical protein